MIRHVPSCSVVFRRVPSCSVVFRRVPSCSVVFRRVPSCSVMFRHVPSCSVMFRHVPSCSVMFCARSGHGCLTPPPPPPVTGVRSDNEKRSHWHLPDTKNKMPRLESLGGWIWVRVLVMIWAQAVWALYAVQNLHILDMWQISENHITYMFSSFVSYSSVFEGSLSKGAAGVHPGRPGLDDLDIQVNRRGAWRNMTEHDGTWRNMTEHDGTWRNMTEHEGTWRNMTEHDGTRRNTPE